MARETSIVLLPSASWPLTGDSPGAGEAVDLAAQTSLDLLLEVATIPSGAKLDVWLETSTNRTTWRVLGDHFLMVDSLPRELAQTFVGADRYVRARWALTGGAGAQASFALTGVAVLVYATPADFYSFGLPRSRLTNVRPETIDKYLRLGSDEADIYLDQRFGLPLSAWPAALRNIVCSIGAWMFLTKNQGTNPEEGADNGVKDNSEAAYRKLRDIANGNASLPGVVDSTPEIQDDGGAVIYSDSLRGWNR